MNSSHLAHVIEEKREGWIQVTERRGRKGKQLLDDLKEITGYWKLQEEAIYCTLWRIRFGRGYGLVVRQNAERISLNIKNVRVCILALAIRHSNRMQCVTLSSGLSGCTTFFHIIS